MADVKSVLLGIRITPALKIAIEEGRRLRGMRSASEFGEWAIRSQLVELGIKIDKALPIAGQSPLFDPFDPPAEKPAEPQTQLEEWVGKEVPGEELVILDEKPKAKRKRKAFEGGNGLTRKSRKRDTSK
jgi:hypothetical protein